MSGDLVTAGPSSGSLALRSDQREWTPEQAAALVQLGIADAPAGDQAVFLHVCQRTGLDPWSRQIYMIGRKERKDGREDIRYTIQTGIDGFRVIAERHDQYGGQLEPQWCGEDGQWVSVWVPKTPPVASRVGVIRHDWRNPVYATVHFTEFAARYSGGGLMPMWRDKPAHMIAKVAEAHALRKAFPQDLSGLYTDDEMAHVDHPGPSGMRGTVVEQAPATAADLTAGAPAADDPNARMQPQQTARVMQLLRDVEIPDRWAWVSAELGREVRSWAAVKVADADQIIAALEQLRAEQTTAPADEDEQTSTEETPS